MADELPRREHGWNELRAVHNGVKSALQERNHVRARIAFHADRLLVDAAELPFRDVAIVAAQLLFRAQLNAVVRELALAPLPVLSGSIFTAVDRAFGPAPD